MKTVGIILLLILMAGVGFVSAVTGALMLTTGSPTRGNWLACYTLTYAVPALLLIAAFFLVRSRGGV